MYRTLMLALGTVLALNMVGCGEDRNTTTKTKIEVKDDGTVKKTETTKTTKTDGDTEIKIPSVDIKVK